MSYRVLFFNIKVENIIFFNSNGHCRSTKQQARRSKVSTVYFHVMIHCLPQEEVKVFTNKSPTTSSAKLDIKKYIDVTHQFLFWYKILIWNIMQGQIKNSRLLIWKNVAPSIKIVLLFDSHWYLFLGRKYKHFSNAIQKQLLWEQEKETSVIEIFEIPFYVSLNSDSWLGFKI